MERAVLHDIAAVPGPVTESTLAAEFHYQATAVEVLRAHETRRNGRAVEAAADDWQEVIDYLNVNPDALRAVRYRANGRGCDEPLGAQQAFRFPPVDLCAL